MVQNVSVVVPAHNAEKSIGECIQSLIDLDYPRDDYEIIIVDNASRDGTESVIKSYPVAYVFQPRPGAAAARNMGVSTARGDYIAFTDSDCVVDRRWITELIKGFTGDRVASVGGMINVPPPRTDLEHYNCRYNPISQENAIEKNVILFPHPITANVMFRRDIFDKVGFFDEEFPMAGGEDLDFGWRIHWAGYEIKYVPGAKVEHRHKSRVRQLFWQHFRYGYAWSLIMRKHAHLFKKTFALTSWGLNSGDMRALFNSGMNLLSSPLKERDMRQLKFKYYELVRILAECVGKAAPIARFR